MNYARRSTRRVSIYIGERVRTESTNSTKQQAAEPAVDATCNRRQNICQGGNNADESQEFTS